MTLFGESAGSGSVSAQMASPLAKGLFQRAIGESGSALNGSSGLALPPLAAMEAQDEAFAKNVLGASTLAEQRAIPASQLLEAQMKKDEKGAVVRFLAGVDGYLLPENPTAIFAAGKQNDVPLLAGWNRDERGIDPKATVESFKALAAKELPGHVEEAMTAYSASDDAAAVRAQTDLAGDLFIAYATWRWLESQAATGKQPVYRYSFDLAPPADPNHPGGLSAYHSAEIPYVFGTLDLLSPFGYAWRPEDRKLSDAMQRYWTNFAKTGDPNGGPNGDGLAKWPAYAASTQWQVMHLAPELAARPDDHRNRDLFLDGLLRK